MLCEGEVADKDDAVLQGSPAALLYLARETSLTRLLSILLDLGAIIPVTPRTGIFSGRSRDTDSRKHRCTLPHGEADQLQTDMWLAMSESRRLVFPRQRTLIVSSLLVDPCFGDSL